MIDRTTQVAVFEEVGQPLKLQTADVPPLELGETLVRVICCTICGSDLHTVSGNRSSPTPSVLGHEIIGVVEETTTAADISGAALEKGDRITWSVAASCGACPRCRAGLPQKCHSLFKYGHEVFESPHALNGGLAEYCVLHPSSSSVRLPEALPNDVASPASCATATVAAAIRVADGLADKRVLVFGAGMLGLTTCAWAKHLGAQAVTICDPNSGRLERAARFGADTLLTAAPDTSFDRVFEMSGHPSAVANGIAAGDIGARVVLVGSVSPSPTVPLDPEHVVRCLLSIHGVHNYHPMDLVAAVEFLSQTSDTFPFAELVEKTFPLSQVNEAFDFASTHRPVRVAVVPNAKH